MNVHPHPIVDGPVPYGPGVLTVGGTMCTSYNHTELTSYPGLAELVDQASEGVIYMSFGSLQMDLPKPEQSKWLQIFGKLPYKVVWKQNAVADLPANVHLFSWLPQQTLLQHPNLKLFITHGGHSSKTEIACAGRPMLVVPQFAKDQFYNAGKAAELGIGDSIMNFLETPVEEVVEKMLNLTDGRYTRKLRSVRRQLLGTRLTMGQVVGHLDAVVTGYSFLPGYQPWYEYLYLDVLLVPVLVVGGAVLVRRRKRS